MRRDRRYRITAALALAAAACAARAAPVEVAVADAAGRPLAAAVVFLESPAARAAAKPLQGYEIGQQDKQFQPQVNVVTLGSQVRFPNRDTVRHHVYSFSPAKTFDLPLYAGTPAAPLRFDKPGVVSIGCNIHDWMIGYIVVLDTPYFAKTDAKGHAALALPPGKYRLRTWHPRLAGEAPEQTLTVGSVALPAIAVHLKLSPPAPPRRGMRRLGPATQG